MSMLPDDDDETRLVRRDNDESRLDQRDGDDNTRIVRRDVGGDAGSAGAHDDQTRVVDRRPIDPENDQTRVVDRRAVDETRIVHNDVGTKRTPAAPDGDEATRLSDRRSGAVVDVEVDIDTDPDRTQLSTRPPGGHAQQDAAPAAPQASASRENHTGVPLGVAAGVRAGLAHPPDAPIGSTASYGVRAPEPAAPLQRLDIGAEHPPVALPATAEEIRRASGTRARRRSVVAISVIVLATAVVAVAAIVAAIVISGL